MKHFISVDMEGVAGISNWREMEADVKRVNNLITDEVNALIEGILTADPETEEILVCDSHSWGDNIYPEKLNERAELIRGNPRRNFMMVGIGSHFDLSYYIGYHCSAGTEGAAMDHTFSGASICEVRINNQVVGEFEMNAGYAGSYGVPPALVSGDLKFCRDIEKLKLGTLTVSTKVADTRFCSRLYHPKKVLKELKEKAEKAVKAGKSSFKPLVFKKPYTVTVTFPNSIKADMASLIPSVKRVGGVKVEYVADNYSDLYNMFEAIVYLARVKS